MQNVLCIISIFITFHSEGNKRISYDLLGFIVKVFRLERCDYLLVWKRLCDFAPPEREINVNAKYICNLKNLENIMN